MFKNQGFSVLTTIIIIAIIAFGGYAVWKNRSSTPIGGSLPDGEAGPTSPDVDSFTTAPAPTTDLDTADWKTYRNEKYGFEFDYSKTFTNPQVDTIGKPNGLDCLLSGELYDQKEFDQNKNTDNDLSPQITFCVIAGSTNATFVDLDKTISAGHHVLFWSAPLLSQQAKANRLDLIKSTFRFVK